MVFEVVLIAALIMILAVSIWWFAVGFRYRMTLDNTSYPRGANAFDGDTVNLTCDGGNVICMFRATQICTVPDANNFETSNLEPISNGSGNVKYGDFDPSTTVDLTQEIGYICNGKTSCSYTVNADWSKLNDAGTSLRCNGSSPSNSQVIATYSCIPSGTECQMWHP